MASDDLRLLTLTQSSAGDDGFSSFPDHLKPQLNLVLRLFPTGLSTKVCDSMLGESKVKVSTDEWKLQALFDDDARWQSLVSLLGMVDTYTGDVGNQTSSSSIGGHKNDKTWWPYYIDALKVLCEPLAELIISVGKKIVLEKEMSLPSAHLTTLHDVFLQFCDGCLFLQRCTSDKGDRETDDNNKAMFNVALGAFFLSLRTQLKLEISARLVEHVIASPWIQSQELKYLFQKLYNTGVVLCRNMELNKACEALKLSSKASWRRVELLCQMFVNQCRSSDNGLSEDSIIDFAGEACNTSAIYLRRLQQCSRCVTQSTVHILENWLSAEHLIRRLPGPEAIVKQWVKMERECHRNLDAADSCTTLYSLLSSSPNMSKRGIGKILEQELLAYDEIFPLTSKLGQQTQINIADNLLKHVYVTEDLHVDRAKILIRKAQITRTAGTEHLSECICFLSEAISILGDIHQKPKKEGIYILPIAYGIRAFCTQESEPDSKKVFQDISTSLNMWLRILSLDDCGDSLPTENIIPLLYNMIDLMSVKGCTEFHHQIYQLLFKLFKLKNVKVEVCLSMLWECRRLRHAFCPSTISDAFIRTLSENFGDKSMCIDFWTDCLKDSKAKLVGFQQKFHDLHNNFLRAYNKDVGPFRSDITKDEIKDAASELISRASLSGNSSFVAAYLYYDLCERLISCGKISEALSYASEAYRIRILIFQDNFKYTFNKKRFEEHDDAGKISNICFFDIEDLQVYKWLATDFWPCGNFLWDINRCYLSRWSVLQCYLESILQVGTLNELIGNGLEAESLLSRGKAISYSLSLFHSVVAFSSALGNLYRKKQCLSLAEKELLNAKEIIIANERYFSCIKCKLQLEVTLDKQLGDISRKKIDRVLQADGFLHAESLFSTALGKVCCSAWKNCITSHGEEIAEKLVIDRNGGEVLGHKSSKTKLSIKEPTGNRGSRRGRRVNQTCLSKDQDLISEQTSRLTRSMCLSLKEQCQIRSNVPEVVSKKPNFCDGSDGSRGERVLCICYKEKCQQCLSKEVTGSRSLNNFISLEWDLWHRKLASSILVSLGKLLADSGRVHQAHKAFLHSISVLFKSNWSSHIQPSVSQLLEFIREEVARDVFAVDRAIILYNLCWLNLRNYHCRESRSICCELFHIPFSKLVSWLMLAFVLSKEFPILFQKVSRLLASLYLLSSSSVEFSFEYDGNELSASHWVSFFHQASLGTHISYHFISDLSRKHKLRRCLSDKECTDATCLSCMVPEDLDLPRIAPERTEDLVQFAKEFFINLPSTTIICISVFGGALNHLLQELMHTRSPVCAWVLISRLNPESKPVATLLPVDSVLEDMSDDSANLISTKATQVKCLKEPWTCPWGATVVDEVAPSFKSILEESCRTSSSIPDNLLWWEKREELDNRLGIFLRKLEASWLGPWRCLFLGDWSNYKLPDSVQKKLVNDLKSKCKMDVNEVLLKAILGGGMGNFKGEACVAQLSLRNGCYVGREGYLYEEDSCKTPTDASNISESRLEMALKLIHDAATKLGQQDEHENREPIILVLDPEVQMLPWENIPILRKQEVYRMPSVGCISAVLKRRDLRREPARSDAASFPLIDPLDSFYLLNPDGDFTVTQDTFEGWFREQNFEGKAGSKPTSVELIEALKSHDLFLYFGHHDGGQYISKGDIEKLDNCSATFLMGCSSGSLRLNGCYIPVGIALSYLLAGSPAIVANLWDVTDKEIDRFGKALLEAWLEERSDSSSGGGCSECESLAKELAVMNLKKGRSTTKRSRKACLRNKPARSNVDGSGKIECNHKQRRKIGSFIAAARDACRLKHMTGAAPVCYGVPTGITRKKGMDVRLPSSSSAC